MTSQNTSNTIVAFVISVVESEQLPSGWDSKDKRQPVNTLRKLPFEPTVKQFLVMVFGQDVKAVKKKSIASSITIAANPSSSIASSIQCWTTQKSK